MSSAIGARLPIAITSSAGRTPPITVASRAYRNATETVAMMITTGISFVGFLASAENARITVAPPVAYVR